MLVASPCGTAGESDGDAGASAAFAVAAAAAARAHGVAADPWISSDGIGVLASGADEAVLADVLARSFAVDPVEGARAAQSRLLETVRPGLAALAQAIAPGRPAAIVPTGTTFSLLRLSEASIAARADALRRGPLRVAVLAKDDAAHADAAAARVDRWLVRAAHDDKRSCPARATAQPPKPGTYAVATDDGTSEAYIAALVPAESEVEAAAITAVLDGEGGLLDGALGDGSRVNGARDVLGEPGSRAIVVHVDAPANALDAAVAQVRALFDRVRQGAIHDEDLARVKKRARCGARGGDARSPRAPRRTLSRRRHTTQRHNARSRARSGLGNPPRRRARHRRGAPSRARTKRSP